METRYQTSESVLCRTHNKAFNIVEYKCWNVLWAQMNPFSGVCKQRQSAVCTGKGSVLLVIACHKVCQAVRDSTACRPVLFLKPPSAAVFASAQNAQVPIELVKGKGSVHYEAEVVLRLNEALEVDAVTLGLDLTLRDLQAQIKKNGHPWEISKVQYLKWLPADMACL